MVVGVQFYNSEGTLKLRAFGKEIESFINANLGDIELTKDANVYKAFVSFKSTIPGIDTNTENVTVTRNLVIEFGMSNEKVDAGQSFLPYFDGTNVTPKNRRWLSGLGLLHYTRNHTYAGYVKPYLKTLNYGDLFLTETYPVARNFSFFIGCIIGTFFVVLLAYLGYRFYPYENRGSPNNHEQRAPLNNGETQL